MRRGRRALLGVVAVLMTGTGCAGAGDAWPLPAPDDAVLVTYARSGGVAGERTELTVAADGEATLDGRRGGREVGWTRRLPADELDHLREVLGSARFAELEPAYRPSSVCSDCFVEEVTHGGRTVSAEGDVVPVRLAEPLRLLRELASA